MINAFRYFLNLKESEALQTFEIAHRTCMNSSATDESGTKTSANVRGGLSSWTISFILLLLLLQSTISVQTRRTLRAEESKSSFQAQVGLVGLVSQPVEIGSVILRQGLKVNKFA